MYIVLITGHYVKRSHALRGLNTSFNNQPSQKKNNTNKYDVRINFFSIFFLMLVLTSYPIVPEFYHMRKMLYPGLTF